MIGITPKKAMIGVGIGIVIGLGIAYMKRPKGKIIINKDGSGIAFLGNKKMSFSPLEGVHLSTWNGYTLDASSTSLMFRKNGTVLEEGKITKYDGGSSNIEIIHNE